MERTGAMLCMSKYSRVCACVFVCVCACVMRESDCYVCVLVHVCLYNEHLQRCYLHTECTCVV